MLSDFMADTSRRKKKHLKLPTPGSSVWRPGNGKHLRKPLFILFCFVEAFHIFIGCFPGTGQDGAHPHRDFKHRLCVCKAEVSLEHQSAEEEDEGRFTIPVGLVRLFIMLAHQPVHPTEHALGRPFAEHECSAFEMRSVMYEFVIRALPAARIIRQA